MTQSSPLAIVTGAPGWLGTRLVETLVTGMSEVPGLEAPLGERRVRCLCLPGSDTSSLSKLSDRVQLVEGDLTDAASVKRLFEGAKGATVFHSAGVIHPTRGVKQFTDVNVEGTRRIAAEAESAGARRLVHVSSNSPIGVNPRPDHVFDEQSPYAPYMGYGKSKMLGEEIVNAAGKGGKLETVIIRPPWFYGPGQPARQAPLLRDDPRRQGAHRGRRREPSLDGLHRQHLPGPAPVRARGSRRRAARIGLPTAAPTP